MDTLSRTPPIGAPSLLRRAECLRFDPVLRRRVGLLGALLEPGPVVVTFYRGVSALTATSGIAYISRIKGVLPSPTSLAAEGRNKAIPRPLPQPSPTLPRSH